MNTVDDADFPEEVKQAIHQNRKIEAIKLLREHAGIGLKEAKHRVDAYARAHPDLIKAAEPAAGSLNLLLVIAAAVLAYGIYMIFK